MLNRTPNDVYVVILAGGKGKRLRPLSTDSRPKAFLSITADRKTMFRRTVERARQITDDDNIVVVTNKTHGPLVKKDLPRIAKGNLILEPASKNTAPAIAFASWALRRRRSDAIIVALPTDQYIMGEAKYTAAVKNGIDFVRRVGGAIVALGVKPESPSTELGYIKVKSQKAKGKSLSKVEKFVEKPGLNTAKKYVRSGQYLWNTGAFIFRAETMVDAVRRHAPEIANCLEDLDDIKKCYARLPEISLDYAVIEKADDLYCATSSFRWKDMGSFESIKEILGRESRRFIEKDGKIVKVI